MSSNLPTQPIQRCRKAVGYIFWVPSLFGFAGLHRIYMGRWISGLIWLFTGGLCGVGTLVDFFMMPRMIRDVNRGAPTW